MRRAALLVVVAASAAAVAALAWTDDDDAGVACDSTLVAANRGSDGNTDIAVYDGDDVRSLTPDWITASPSFSPDGEHAVFVRGDAGWADAGPITTELWIAPVREGAEEPRNLLRSEGLRYDPAWSPTGDKIVYVEQAGEDRVLRIVNADGSDPRVVLEEPGVDLVAPAWSPDGKELAYIERRLDRSGYSYDIGILDLNAAASRSVATVPDASTLSWAPDGQSLLVSTYDDEDGTIALLDIASGASTTIAEHATKATLADDTTVFYLDRIRPAIWQLAVGHLDNDRLVHDRRIGSDEIYNYGHFGLDAAPCSG